MLVSVIIPVYQVENYIEKCLATVINQTYSNLEIIIVDDGSKDKSGLICDIYGKRDKRIRIIHKQNGGLMSAWLAGLHVATGEYLFFVDSDDWIELNAIEQMVLLWQKYKADIICCNYFVEYEGNHFPDYHTVPFGFYDKKGIQENIAPNLICDGKYLSRGVRICRWGKLIKRELLSSYVQYCNVNITIGEDKNIMVPTIMNANSIFIMDGGCFYHYRMNHNSIMKKMSPIMWNQIKLQHDTMKTILNDLCFDGLLKQEIMDYCDLSVMIVGKELKTFSRSKNNLISLYKSTDYLEIKNNIILSRYRGIDRKAAQVILSKNKILYSTYKIEALIDTILGRVKVYVKKVIGRKR